MTRPAYPLTVDGKELSTAQRQLFDKFLAAFADVKARREPILQHYREAKAAGRDPLLSEEELTLLWLFGDISDEGASAQ